MLKDLIVVELASVLAGPDVGMFFAEMGARVIKIENKTTNGDVTRQWRIASEKSNQENISAYFSAVNWNKEHLFLDLKQANDKKKVVDLLKDAAIVIANFKPGDAEKFSLDYNSIKQINPTIIYGEINGFGAADNRVAYDVVLQAETGFMAMNGTTSSGPLKMPVAMIDVLAAHQLKEGILVALLNKTQSGKGAYVQVALYDAALSSLKNQATNWLMNAENTKLLGSLHPNIAPYGETFQTKDGKWIVLAIGTDKQFNHMLTIIGATILIKDERFSSNVKRVANRSELDDLLKNYFNNISLPNFQEKFHKANIPFGVIKDIKTVFEEDKANALVLEEKVGSINTKRIKTAVFKITEG